jgi:hypothetical protein
LALTSIAGAISSSGSSTRSSSGIATRYDKLATNYLAFIKLAAIRIWLRSYESVSNLPRNPVA